MIKVMAKLPMMVTVNDTTIDGHLVECDGEVDEDDDGGAGEGAMLLLDTLTWLPLLVYHLQALVKM